MQSNNNNNNNNIKKNNNINITAAITHYLHRHNILASLYETNSNVMIFKHWYNYLLQVYP